MQPVVSNEQTDPTDVMAKRIGAFLIDASLVLIGTVIAAAAALRPGVEEFTSLEDAEAFCDGAAPGISCFASPDLALSFEFDGLWLTLASHLGLWLVMALFEGLTGASIGKHLTGLRVVHADGQLVGIGAAVLRSVVGIVDSFPWGTPMLTGMFFAANSPGHQRLGDRLANTFVVDKARAGSPLPAKEAMNPILGYPRPAATLPPPRPAATLAPPRPASTLAPPRPASTLAPPRPASTLPPPRPASAQVPQLPVGVVWDEASFRYVFDDGQRRLQWDADRQVWTPA